MASRGHANILMSATSMYPAAYNTLGVEVQLPSFPIQEGTVELKGIKPYAGMIIDHETGVITFCTHDIITPKCEILYYPIIEKLNEK